MSRKTLLAGGALAASVFVGGVAGALLFTPALSSAEISTTSPVAAAGGPAGLGLRPGAGPDVLATAATALGMTEADLRTALQGGKTIAQVAKDKGVDVDKVIDALVADQSARLDQAVTGGKLTQAQATAAKAALRQRVTAMVNGEGPAGHPSFGRRFGSSGQPPRGEGASTTS
jgi:hypothetical protein